MCSKQLGRVTLLRQAQSGVNSPTAHWHPGTLVSGTSAAPGPGREEHPTESACGFPARRAQALPGQG